MRQEVNVKYAQLKTRLAKTYSCAAVHCIVIQLHMYIFKYLQIIEFE